MITVAGAGTAEGRAVTAEDDVTEAIIVNP
jgi:hypothetical protein